MDKIAQYYEFNYNPGVVLPFYRASGKKIKFLAGYYELWYKNNYYIPGSGDAEFEAITGGSDTPGSVYLMSYDYPGDD